jgi:hypothetical protein
LRFTLFALLAVGTVALLTAFMIFPEAVFGLLAGYVVVAGVYLIRQRKPGAVRDSAPLAQPKVPAPIY